MADDVLKDLIETNFKFLAITMRDIAGRTNQTEAKLTGVQRHITGVEEGFRSVQTHLRHVDTNLLETVDLTRQNREDFERMANRLDQAVAALSALADSGTEHRRRFEAIERRLDALESPKDQAS